MIGRGSLALLMMAVAVPLAGCGEKAQTAGSTKKSDAKAWEGTQGSAYAAGGWKAGDKDSWEAQLKTRAEQGQNEYSRSPAAAGEAKSQ